MYVIERTTLLDKCHRFHALFGRRIQLWNRQQQNKCMLSVILIFFHTTVSFILVHTTCIKLTFFFSSPLSDRSYFSAYIHRDVSVYHNSSFSGRNRSLLEKLRDFENINANAAGKWQIFWIRISWILTHTSMHWGVGRVAFNAPERTGNLELEPPSWEVLNCRLRNLSAVETKAEPVTKATD